MKIPQSLVTCILPFIHVIGEESILLVKSTKSSYFIKSASTGRGPAAGPRHAPRVLEDAAGVDATADVIKAAALAAAAALGQEAGPCAAVAAAVQRLQPAAAAPVAPQRRVHRRRASVCLAAVVSAAAAAGRLYEHGPL